MSDTFLDGYRLAMIWANTLAYSDDGELVNLAEHPEYRSGPGDATEWARDMVRKMSHKLAERAARDCEDFQETHAELLAPFVEIHGESEAGHCFALSRNGHGAGFGPTSDALQRLAKQEGEETWLLTANGRIELL